MIFISFRAKAKEVIKLCAYDSSGGWIFDGLL
jgi:hypothetical protein